MNWHLLDDHLLLALVMMELSCAVNYYFFFLSGGAIYEAISIVADLEPNLRWFYFIFFILIFFLWLYLIAHMETYRISSLHIFYILL